jgi:polar amino acid transport system substrate-binding protein
MNLFPLNRRQCIAFMGAAATTGCASTGPNAEVVKGLAPSGRLRACINLGNPILARRDAASGQALGVSVDLARALGAELGVPVELVVVEAAARSVETVKTGEAERYLAAFVERAKAAGRVAQSLQRHDIQGARVAPAA